MNRYTLYCINLDTMEIVAQQWRAKNATAALGNWRRHLRYVGFIEKGGRYYIELYNGKRKMDIPEGFGERAEKSCKIAR